MNINEAALKILKFGLDGSSVENSNSEERIKTYLSYIKEIQEKILNSELILKKKECDPNKPDYKECLARHEKLRDMLINFSIISISNNLSTPIDIKEKIDILLNEYNEICKQMGNASEFFNISE
ncbi:hypothetical protein [Nostoc sp. DSM 114167]|jgi:hypothetical protein|uniref:hypothetical protein n=1 Tax=Nostoc sp. DSM 114167 TaxID=3439050 RepID=UPI004045CC30